MAIQFAIDSTILTNFLFYATIVLAKTMVMSYITGATRGRKMVFSNPEDAANIRDAKVKYDDPDIERIRRCHLNDLENVYLFVLLGFLYCFIGPNPTTALWHFRIFTISRISHTITYLGQLQPYRAIAFVVGTVVCLSMITQVILATY